jgi:hypothetical protein
MMEEITGLLAVIFFFSTIALIWGSFIFTRYKERMTMIEKGMKAEDIKSLYERHAWRINPLMSLKWGIVLICVGAAILIGMWLRNAFFFDEGVFPGLIATFGGLGLVLFYVDASRKQVQ